MIASSLESVLFLLFQWFLSFGRRRLEYFFLHSGFCNDGSHSTVMLWKERVQLLKAGETGRFIVLGIKQGTGEYRKQEKDI